MLDYYKSDISKLFGLPFYFYLAGKKSIQCFPCIALRDGISTLGNTSVIILFPHRISNTVTSKLYCKKACLIIYFESFVFIY